INLAEGSLIDTSSGGAVTTAGKVVGGRGGDIALLARIGQNATGEGVTLKGSLRSYGYSRGGALTVQTRQKILIADAAAAGDDTLLLHPEFFTHGFASYDLAGSAGVTVADGTVVNVVQPVYRVGPTTTSTATGADPVAAFGPAVLPPLFLETLTATLVQR